MVTHQLEHLPDLVNADPALVRRGAALSTTFLLGVGDVPYYVSVRDGRIAALERGPALLRRVSFSIRASAEAWLKHWQPLPEPGAHDIFAMAKAGEAVIEGDLLPLMQHLRYIKEVLAAPRRLAEHGHDG